MRALILAGGFGKRLRPFTNEVPKSMLQVGHRPLIEWQIQWLKSNGIDEVVICVGYLQEKIIDFIDDGSRLGLSVHYSSEEKMLGTGGAIKNAQNILFSDAHSSTSGNNATGRGRYEENFLVVNGDVLTTISLSKVIRSNLPTVCAVPMRSPYGVIITADDNNYYGDNSRDQDNLDGEYDENKEDPCSDDSSFVTAFLQKPTMDDIWINAGVYYFQRDIFGYLPQVGDFEATVLPMLARQGRLKAVKFDKSQYYWRSIDSHWDLEEAQLEVHLAFKKHNI